MTHRTAVVIALLASALLVAGCYTPPPVYYVQARPQRMRVPGPPPAPRLEVPPPQPDESYLWRDGYWAWDGSDYVWVAGEWMPPQAGYLYIASSVAFLDGCWQYQPGYWCADSICGGSGFGVGFGGGKHHGKHQGGAHGGAHGGVIAHGPAVEVPPSSARARAPEAGDTSGRVRAPEAQAQNGVGEPVRVRAPEAPDLKDPDADGAGQKRLPAWKDDSYRSGHRPSVSLSTDDVTTSDDDEPAPVSLRRRPDYLGSRAGRPAFGDDPTSDRPRVALPEHSTDATGAIVLAEPRSRAFSRGGRVIIVAPRPSIAAPPMVRVRTPDTTVAAPELHRAPPPAYREPPPAYREPPPAYREPPRVSFRPAPSAPAYSPPPMRAAPAPVFRPAPAPVYRPSYHAVAPQPSFRPSAPAPAPARVQAPAHASPSSGGGRRHR